MKLYAHPFSSYCQKALIALYENNIPFEWRMLYSADDTIATEHATLWPLKRMPVLVDEGRTIVEASIIIEHLDLYHRGPVRFIPEDAVAALDVRMMDRFFDNYVMTPLQKIVGDRIRAAEAEGGGQEVCAAVQEAAPSRGLGDGRGEAEDQNGRKHGDGDFISVGVHSRKLCCLLGGSNPVKALHRKRVRVGDD